MTTFRTHLAGRLGAWLIRLIGATWRVRIEGIDPRAESTFPQLGALWHRDALVAGYVFRDAEIAMPISRSRDGDLAAAIAMHLGFTAPPRGSSSQGGTPAVRGLITKLREGHTAAIVIDGPRGPARVPKPGIIALSGWADTPVTGLAFSARSCFRLASWDRTLIPLPFSSVTCRFLPPLRIDNTEDPEAREAGRRKLEIELNRATDELDTANGLEDVGSS